MKINGWQITQHGTRIRLTRGTRHHYLTKSDGQWRQTTKDGAPAPKSIPLEDMRAIVRAVREAGL